MVESQETAAKRCVQKKFCFFYSTRKKSRELNHNTYRSDYQTIKAICARPFLKFLIGVYIKAEFYLRDSDFAIPKTLM